MDQSKFRNIAGMLALCGGAMSAPAFAGQLAEATFENKMLAIISELESGTLAVDSAIERCAENFSSESNSGTLRDVITGFLNVERDEAFEAGCGAIIHALDSGEFSGTDLRELLIGKNDRKKETLSGRLLRVVYFTHEGGK